MGTGALAIPFVAEHIAHGSYDTTTIFLIWTGVLFLGRTGAAIVEDMSEIFFFKQVDGRNAGYMGFYRRMRPLAYIVGPLTASILLRLELVTLGGLFVVLAAVMFAGLYLPLRLTDTK
jgi:hypothetical protein